MRYNNNDRMICQNIDDKLYFNLISIFLRIALNGFPVLGGTQHAWIQTWMGYIYEEPTKVLAMVWIGTTGKDTNIPWNQLLWRLNHSLLYPNQEKDLLLLIDLKYSDS